MLGSRMVETMPKANRRFLLISDLDGTLLGDAAALETFRQWYHQHQHVLAVVYNSGRLIPDLCQCLRQERLPQPLALIGGVGTQVWDTQQGLHTGWPPVKDEWDAERVRDALSAFPQLQLQPEEFLTPLKVSYSVDNVSDTFFDTVQRHLERHKLRATIVFSSQRDLDVFPHGVNKGVAARYLAQHLGFPPERVFVSGDTANDLTMFHNGFRGIVVAKAHEELKQLGASNVYHAQCGYAAGVVEGITYRVQQPSA